MTESETINISGFTAADYRIDYEEPFEEVCEHLVRLSTRLQELLPDPSLSPDERLERIARVIPTSVLISDHHKTARTKLNQLRRRLSELVPDETLDHHQKLEYLVEQVHALVPTDEPRLFKKLEALGDGRRSDIGR
jgi:predicted nuclease with TOPRIM domain